MSDSNIDSFSASLDRLRDPLDFERDGLGKRIVESQVRRILDRAANQQGDQGRWDDNRGKYGEAKARKGLPVGVGLRPSDSPMLSAENVRGEPTITADEIEMRHGATDEARKVGELFSIDRPFYGLTAQDSAEIRDECAASVARKLGS